MAYNPPTVDQLNRLLKRRTDAKACAESLLVERRAEGVKELTGPDEVRFRSMMADVEALNAEIADYRADLERATIPERYANLGKGMSNRQHGSAAAASPLAFDQDELRSAHGRLSRGETAILQTTRAFSSASSVLPAQLYGIPTFPRHENRLVDRLPGIALDVPSLEYVQVSTVSGAAQIVGEGMVKPEVTMPPTPLICTAKKLAVHAGISWESWADYTAFTQAVQNELIALVVDLENEELYGGDPATGGLNSLTKTVGVLTLAATGGAATPPNSWDDIAAGIAKLRTGPALANPDLLLLHPDTWAEIRTQKDTLGRYISGTDPTDASVSQAWGVEVLQSTGFTAGEGVLLDSQLVGKVAVRETITMRLGYSGDDLTRNIVRVVVEERLNFAIERPAAICHITGLPTAAATSTTRGSKAKAKD